MSIIGDLFTSAPAQAARDVTKQTLDASQAQAQTQLAAAKAQMEQLYGQGQQYFEKGLGYYDPLKPAATSAYSAVSTRPPS